MFLLYSIYFSFISCSYDLCANVVAWKTLKYCLRLNVWLLSVGTVAMTGIFAQASLSRLGENSITLPWFLLELLLRRRAFVLSDDTSRSSERLSPKRELVGA